ncbi:MAG: hypothetical protein WA766_11765 [Candidatus Acidiferrales bacterium]
MTDINNTVFGASSLTATMYDSPYIVATAPDLEVPVTITGDLIYLVPNQFFELTDQIAGSGAPLYYQHPLPIGVTQVTVLDLLGNTVPASNYVVRTLTRGTATNTYVLHSFPSVNNPNVDFIPYQVRFVDAQGFLHLELLKFGNVIAYNPFTASAATYTTTTLTLNVFSAGVTYYIRWYAQNGYQLLSPYGTTPNDPWFIRVRFNQVPPPPEWATQVWSPQRPFILATWVPGTVLSQNVIQFERRPIYFQNAQYPDILVYDKNYVLKYALAGKTGNGFLYPWQLNQFVDIDPNTGLVQISVNVDPTDIIFGFYSYQETDVIFNLLDLNPYTDPAIRNRIVNFYEKSDGVDLLHYIYYQVLNADGSIYSTNDPAPSTGTNNFFGTVLVGQATSVGDFTFTDIRQRGGGLAPAYQNIPQAVNFWDLGFWDGKPFPAGGAMIIYLPVTVQNEFSTDEIASIIGAVVPMGTIPVIRYYDSQGNETVA